MLRTNITRTKRLRYPLVYSCDILVELLLQTLLIGDWIRDAKARTEAYRNGSNAPVAWVLTNGTHIPRDAIEGGEDERGNALYIARAFQGVRRS
jgi:hypothetical protein